MDPSAPGVLQLSCGLGGEEAYGWVARTAGEAQRALAAAKHAEGHLQRLAERVGRAVCVHGACVPHRRQTGGELLSFV